MGKIGECGGCHGDIIERPVSGAVKPGFGSGMAQTMEAVCSVCGALYDRDIVKQKNRSKPEEPEDHFVRTWGVPKETPAGNSRG